MSNDFGVGLGLGIAIGFGAGMSTGIAVGLSGRQKHFKSQLAEAIKTQRISVVDSSGRQLSVEELVHLLEQKDNTD